MANQEVKYTERNGEKYVERKSSWIKKVKIIFLIFSIIWIGLAAWFPLYVKGNYSESIKRSIVISMFFDLQQGVADQYAKLLNGVKGAVGKIKNKVDFDKPINAAVDHIKLAQTSGAVVQKQTAAIKQRLDKISSAMDTAKKFGVKVESLEGISKDIDNIANTANSEVLKVNDQLDGVKKTLLKAAKSETDKMFDSVDKMVDEEIRAQLDKATGGLSSLLLTQYKTQHIAPWKPSTWGISNQMYAELEKSSRSTIQIIMGTIDHYFSFVAWGLVAIVWLVALLAWLFVFSKVRALLKPFIVCPNCGHAFADIRTAFGLLKVLQPWKWI